MLGGEAPKIVGGEKDKEPDGNIAKKVDPKTFADMKDGGVGSGTGTLEEEQGHWKKRLDRRMDARGSIHSD